MDWDYDKAVSGFSGGLRDRWKQAKKKEREAEALEVLLSQEMKKGGLSPKQIDMQQLVDDNVDLLLCDSKVALAL